jgi:ATP-binding cassette subfamily E protein 1
MPRIAIVRKERCNPMACGHYLCARLCPVNKEGRDCIKPDPITKKADIDEGLCVGCGICPNKCPFDAIYIANLPNELTTKPIHQYGHNGFHLYNLPQPVFGKVVGIIGRNGIGKSTAIKIFAGVLKPNLGTDTEKSYDELLQYFKGSASQRFFEDIRDGRIKVSYKPQQVDQLAKVAKGKVRELLQKADERKAFDEIVVALDLKNILDADISTLSGGELQRVTIAGTLLKDANLYLIDEPTSFLDIKQRLRVARYIREFPNEKRAVMVIEHDLIVLDAMCDLIHIVFGKEGCYGIVSQPKAARTGMNAYLEGWLRDENMRFRDHAIEFMVRPPQKKARIVQLTSWKGIKTTLGHFTLNAEGGAFNYGEVVGILGENGIGKTTFAKILAHVLKPDAGERDEKLKVSYKPQYLDGESDELVMAVLGPNAKKHETSLMKPLDIHPLLLKPLNTLSGGELQRVAIVKALAEDAELFLLDEPSAFLDVEQRLVASKAIREFCDQTNKTVLVVDHDLMFLDYLSDRLLVFEGEPGRKGTATGPFILADGMNHFLTGIDVTFRRDPESHRPRVNKPGSVADREQKDEGKLYYS